MKSNKSGYEIRSEVLKVAAEICQTRFKDHPNLLNSEIILKLANELYTFVSDKGGNSGAK